MANKLVTEFEAYEFTEEELIHARTFNELQFKYLQTELSLVAQEKLSLRFDPTIPDAFIKEHLYLSGKFDALKMLIVNHIDTMSKLETYARELAFKRAQEEAKAQGREHPKQTQGA